MPLKTGFTVFINRGSYKSAHVLMNLLNKLGKRDNMRGLPSILSLFHNKFNKFNNRGAQILDSIYHMILKLLKNHTFGVKRSRFCHLLCNIIIEINSLRTNL